MHSIWRDNEGNDSLYFPQLEFWRQSVKDENTKKGVKKLPAEENSR